MEVKDIIELMKAVSENGLTKFELEQGETKLVMKREKQIVTVAGVNPVPGGASVMPGMVNGADSMVYTGMPGGGMMPMQMYSGMSGGQMTQDSNDAAAEGGNVVICPLVGTFYSSPSPDAESFVKVGDHVKKGQVLGIVEAMKLMNEIECEYDGVVEAVLVNNEDTVEYGQPLFCIR